VSPPDLIDTKSHDHYCILQNNDDGLVATSSISEIEESQRAPTVGAVTVVINEETGEFWWRTVITRAQGHLQQRRSEIFEPVGGGENHSA
jgi:hypothetical protein